MKWERRRQNHWFDALYNACAAGHYCGVRIGEEPVVVRRQAEPQVVGSFYDVERWNEMQKRMWGSH